jgi:hypothetical protein
MQMKRKMKGRLHFCRQDISFIHSTFFPSEWSEEDEMLRTLKQEPPKTRDPLRHLLLSPDNGTLVESLVLPVL